jgi:AhpD family alkylhydroperoxidase
MKKTELFEKERSRLNRIVMQYAGTTSKRLLSLDKQAYSEGALPVKTKEMLGLVASFVLRCDDCITYHLIQCYKNGVSDQELDDALGIGLLVGGSICIPHLRKALFLWDELKENDKIK